jgi:tetratricopeptide (TPR) repeat protein
VSHGYTLTIAAHVRRDLGEPERAKEYYRRAIELTIQHRLPLIQVVPESALASLCWERGEFEESLELSNDLVTLTRRLNLRRPLAEASGVLSQRLLELERPEEALPHLLDAAEIFEQLGDKQEQIRAMTSIAYVYERCGSDAAAAVAAWQQVQSLKGEQGDAAGELEAFEGMARIARNQQHDAPAALESLSGALEVARRMGHSAKQGDLLNSMGIIEWGRGNFDAALEKYTEALQIFETLEDLAHTGLMLNSIGVTLHKLGRTDEATTQLRQAVELHRRSGHRRLESHALAARGEVLAETSLFDQARECYDVSLDIRREIGDRKGEGWMLHHLAGVLMSQGDREQGLALLDQATAVALETGDQQLGQACARLETELEET